MWRAVHTYNFDVVLDGICLSIIEPRGIVKLVAWVVGSNLNGSLRQALLFLTSESHWLLPAIDNSMVLGVYSFFIDTLSRVCQDWPGEMLVR